MYLPVPRPAKNLAAISIPAPLAKIIRSQFSINGMERIRIVGRRPIFWASTPTGNAAIAAPIANIDETRPPENRRHLKEAYRPERQDENTADRWVPTATGIKIIFAFGIKVSFEMTVIQNF